MSLFGRLFKRKEPVTTHGLVSNEIRSLVCDAFVKRGIAMKQITKETKSDTMKWFIIRPRKYGESGSHYGVPEITSHPGMHNPMWPNWLRHISTAQLKDVGLELWSMAQDRRPLGGHMMDEANHRLAACEFSGHLLASLFEEEEQARI